MLFLEACNSWVNTFSFSCTLGFPHLRLKCYIVRLLTVTIQYNTSHMSIYFVTAECKFFKRLSNIQRQKLAQRSYARHESSFQDLLTLEQGAFFVVFVS